MNKTIFSRAFVGAIVFAVLAQSPMANAGDAEPDGASVCTACLVNQQNKSVVDAESSIQDILSSIFKMDKDARVYVDAGKSSRPKTLDASVGFALNSHLAVELRLADEGKQPDNIRNVNKPVNLDSIISFPISEKLKGFIEAGLTNSDLSYNGSGNTYVNHTGFSGWNFGGGWEYKVTKHISILGDFDLENYYQCDHHAKEKFGVAALRVRYSFAN